MAQDSQAVHDELATFFDQNAPSEAQSLVLINRAIDRSFPPIKFEQYDTAACTLASNTFWYALTLSQTPSRVTGLAQVFVDDIGSRPEVRVHDVTQREELGTWYLRFSERVVTQYNGQDVNVRYQYPHARITGLATGDLELPYDFLFGYCAWFWAAYHLTQGHDANVAGFRDLVAVWEEEWKDALKSNMVMPLGVLKWASPDRTTHWAYKQRKE